MSSSREINSTEENLQCNEILPASPISGSSQHNDRTNTRNVRKHARESGELQLHATDRSSVYKREKIRKCRNSVSTGVRGRRMVVVPARGQQEKLYKNLNVDRENHTGKVAHYYKIN